jgi:hypothetical protein
MSWQATAWADGLPMDAVGPVAFRVLLKLANVADAKGMTAWRMRHDMARELGRSVKTIDRALKELEYAALILPGDQQFVKHMRADRRPKVYDLNLRWAQEFEQPELEGVEDPEERGDTVIHSPPRGDMLHVPHGATADVLQGTILERKNSATRGNHRGDVAPSTSLRSQIDARCPAARKAGHHVFETGGRWLCKFCSQIDIEGNLYDLNSNLVQRAEVNA